MPFAERKWIGKADLADEGPQLQTGRADEAEFDAVVLSEQAGAAARRCGLIQPAMVNTSGCSERWEWRRIAAGGVNVGALLFGSKLLNCGTRPAVPRAAPV
jgi:hypothetical protein